MVSPSLEVHKPTQCVSKTTYGLYTASIRLTCTIIIAICRAVTWGSVAQGTVINFRLNRQNAKCALLGAIELRCAGGLQNLCCGIADAQDGESDDVFGLHRVCRWGMVV